METRRRLPPAYWREWYFDLLPSLAKMRPGDVLASWQRLAAPAYFPRGPAPMDAELVARPYDFLERDGEWWEVEPLTPRPADGAWHVLLDGSMVIGPNGEAIVDREEARRVLAGRLPTTGLVADVIARMPSGRQTGKRSSHHVESLARALAVLGLVDSGMTHRAAVRQWIAWEVELHGPRKRPNDAEPFDDSGYVDQVRMATRQLWRRHGLTRVLILPK